MIVYNVEYANVDIVVVQNDGIDMTFAVTENDEDFDLTGMQVDMTVRLFDGRLIKTFTSAGVTPEITVVDNTFTVYDEDGISEKGIFEYDVQITDGTQISTIMKGQFKVEKEITT